MTIEEIRKDTPGVAHRLHLNSAGASLSPTPVQETVARFQTREAEVGGYEAEEEVTEELQDVYRAVGELLGADPAEIALTESATRAWDQLFYSLTFRPGDRILTARNEYASNYLAFLQRARQDGVEILTLDCDETGAICLEHLDRVLDDRTRLVAVNHMPTNSGMVQPIEKIGARLREHPAFYLVDACQSAGQYALDVREIGCDGLTGTSRKYLRGPRGVGFLYCRHAWIERLEPPFIDLHSASWLEPDRYTFRRDARRFEAYESPVAQRLGFGRAVRYALEVGIEEAWSRIGQLARSLRKGLAEIGGIQVTDRGSELSGIVTFRVVGLEPKEVQHLLRRRGINVWTCTERSALLDMRDRGLPEVVRASVHYYNTMDEMSTFLEAVSSLAKKSSFNGG